MLKVPTVVLITLLLTNSLNAFEKNALYRSIPEEKRALFEANLPKAHEREPYIFYFFSSSVPKHSFLKHLTDVSKLQEHNSSIHSVQLTRGLDGGFNEYLNDIQTRSVNELWFVKDSVRIKIGERMFEEFDINKVPAVAVADCSSNFLHDCTFRFLVRGDVSLEEVLQVAGEELGDQYAVQWQILLKESK